MHSQSIEIKPVLTKKDRKAFVTLLESDNAERNEAILDWVNRCYGIEYARKNAMEFAEQARTELESLSPSACRDVLAEITDFVVARSV